jgi:FMN phosphatase YigB (HAD superfamily)
LAAITFDLWHTLIKMAPAAEDRYIELQESSLAELVRDSPRANGPLGGPFDDPTNAARLAFSAAMGRHGRGSPIAELAVEAGHRAGREPSLERWIRAIESLAESQPFETVSGAREQLERVKRCGYRTAVVSNLVGESGKSMRRIMERLGLARFIDSWAFSEELPWAKPSPEIFWRALEPLGTPPAEAVHVGDLASDIQGARAAGFRCSVQFQGAREYGRLYSALCRTNDPIVPPPDRVLASWSDFPDLLDSLFGKQAPA